MKNKIKTISILNLFIMIMLLFPLSALAGVYWVSPTGTASWANAESETPLSGTACTTLHSANNNAVAGDTIMMRGGTYNTSINPSNTGTSGNVITYEAYTGETPTITDPTAIATYQFGIRLYTTSYIKVDGLTFADPLNRPLEFTWGSSYNEITNCTFNATGIWRMWDGYPALDQGTPCIHNWIHHNTIANTGGVSAGCDDEGGAQIGTPAYDNRSGYNTIEDNTFYCGGHHNLETFTKYNVIRNNVFHHEGCMTPPNPPCPYPPDSNGLYGNRNVQLYDGHNSDGVFNLLEGNRLGHAGRPPDDDGAHNLSITSPKNIVRYNSLFNAAHTGVYFKIGSGSFGNYNRVYNNTVYHNGQNESTGYIRRYGMVFGASATDYTKGNIIKNNIVYDNYSGDFSGRGGLSGLVYQTFSNNWLNETGDPSFANADISDPTSTVLPDLSLKSDSGAINTGTYLTQANGSGSASTTLIVDDALYFQDGSWGSSLSTIDADYISIGTVTNTVQISSINYSTNTTNTIVLANTIPSASANTITLASPMTWSDNATIWLYKDSSGKTVLIGAAPDIGAYEYIPNTKPSPRTLKVTP